MSPAEAGPEINPHIYGQNLLLNGDFSHWYTGLEMVYGGFAKKLEFLAPQ